MRRQSTHLGPKTTYIAAVAAIGFLAGCTNHYKVTDPESGTVYYTTTNKGGQKGRGGAAHFQDARTDSKVTLSSSEVTPISQYEFDQAVRPK